MKRDAFPHGAVELKIDLYCRGLRLGASAERRATLAARTRAGLGSGLELILPGRFKDVFVNVPVEEPFARASPYELEHRPSGFFLCDTRSGEHTQVSVVKEPAWGGRKTSRGVPMSRIGVMQGTYLGVYVGPRCLYWRSDAELACRFCTTGLNVGKTEEGDKKVDDVVETWRSAREESGAVFIHFNTGYQLEDLPEKAGLWGVDRIAPYVDAVKRRVGGLVGVQAMPVGRQFFDRYDRLIDMGVDHFSFCYEFQDPKTFRELCPGKAATHGQEAFFAALEYTAKKMPRGAVSGEIIAGVEPIDATLEAIERITSLGAFPTVCVFRPTVSSRMSDVPPPKFTEMRDVMKAMYEACRRHLVPIGAVPGIDVSIVVTPEDARELVDDGLAERAWRGLLAARRVAARPAVRRKLRPRRAR